MLVDEERLLAYLPISLGMIEELREWSQPVQVRWLPGYEQLEIRTLWQPVKGVYIVPEDTETAHS